MPRLNHSVKTSGISKTIDLGRKTHGATIARWMTDNLVHGPGPLYGQPYTLQPFQVNFLKRLYEYDPVTGRRKVRRALLGIAKGNSKTEGLAAIALAELCGPFAPTAPNIPIAAASLGQAGILFGTAKAMVQEGPLAAFLDVYENRIEVHGGPGVLYKIAAEAATNDGSRPTVFIADELHEWTGRKADVHNIISNSLTKADQPLELNISTAGFDLNSLLGQMYQHGLAVKSGEVSDPSFLFRWYEADPALDLTDPDQLVEAIKQANPGVGSIVSLENVLARYSDPVVPEFRFRRYHLNQWTSSDESWLPAGAWDALLDATRIVEPGTKVVLGLDGSYNGDATALIGVTVEAKPHVFVVGCWERPMNAGEDWTVDVLAVEAAVREACQTFKVLEIVCDPFRWQRSMQVLQQDGLPVLEFPQTATRMTPATTRAIEAVGNNSITQDGDPRLARHVSNAVLKADDRGMRLTKVSKGSNRKIDLAVAFVMAHERAAFNANKPKAKASFIDLADYL